jgi:hypothetical protein
MVSQEEYLFILEVPRALHLET